jgi:uncharacterized membrane protein
MDEIFGIPAHPLFVHVPVVLLPLGAIVAIVLLIKQSWFERYKWGLLGIVGIGAIGAILAASSGEELEGSLRRTEGVSASLEEHAEAGEMARNIGLLFLIVVLAWIFVPIFLKRRAEQRNGDTGQPKWFRPVVIGLVALCSVGTAVAVIDAGHSGAKEVWNEGEGGEEEGDEDGAPVTPPDAPVVTPATATAGG